MPRELSARVGRLEQRTGAANPALLEHVAARLDRLGANDPERANELLVSFGLRPCYPSVPSARQES